MINADAILDADGIELTYDVYPNDERLEKDSRPVNIQPVMGGMGHQTDQVKSDRRSLTYDVYPGNRRQSS